MGKSIKKINVPDKLAKIKDSAARLASDSLLTASLSISTWFCIQDEMKDLEILSRASGFLVKSKDPSKFGRNFHFVTASHSVAPWRWPKYYPQEWIKYIDETNTHYTSEIRGPDGSFIAILDLLPRSYHHPTKDLAVLHFEYEDGPSYEVMGELGMKGEILLPSEIQMAQNQSLEFHGHQLIDPDPEEQLRKPNQDLRKPIPTIVSGSIYGNTPHQNFAYSQRILTDGMCGGPVITRRSHLFPEHQQIIDEVNTKYSDFTSQFKSKEDIIQEAINRRYVVGMTDGIVSVDHPIEKLRGCASYISAHEIARFLDNIENAVEDEVVVLMGGEAAEHVSRDQNPDKLDMHKMYSPYINDD